MTEDEAVILRLSGTSGPVLGLVRTKDALPVAFPANNFGVGKFVNFHVEDIDLVHRELVSRDVPVGDIGKEGTARFFTFFDPDGNRLGVCASL